jgi:hypothetical protein
MGFDKLASKADYPGTKMVPADAALLLRPKFSAPFCPTMSEPIQWGVRASAA